MKVTDSEVQQGRKVYERACRAWLEAEHIYNAARSTHIKAKEIYTEAWNVHTKIIEARNKEIL